MKSLQEKLRDLPAKRRQKIHAKASEIVSEELTLKELRQALNLTQDELAERLGKTQNVVSRLESRCDVKISTLRQAVEALECELVLSVKLPGKSSKTDEARYVELTGY